MLDFIKTTSEIMLKEIPNIFITNVRYECDNGVIIMNVHFYDLDFNTKGFQFIYYDKVPTPLTIEDNLVLEFTAYLSSHVKPFFNTK